MIEWWPRLGQRNQDSPRARWVDNVVKTLGMEERRTEPRSMKQNGEAYTQQVSDPGLK